MDSVCYGVSGINNTQKKTELKNALDKLEGVQNVDIDRTLGTVEVGFNAPADESQIRDCILDTGLKLH